MGGILLAINELHAALREIRDGAGKGDFGGVIAPCEHGFAVERAADLYAVKTATQQPVAVFIGQPAFK